MSRRSAPRCGLLAALALVSTFFVSALTAAPAGAVLPATSDAPAGEVWITLGSDAFDRLAGALRSELGPGTLPRLEERAGVVLTRIPEGALDALSAAMLRELDRHPGFVRHATFARGLEVLDRLERPRQPEVLPFAIDEPTWVATVAGAVSEANVLQTMTALSTSFATRHHSTASGIAAASWIRDLWLGYAAGRPEVTVQLVSHPSTSQPSVVLTIPGSSLADQVVILGGHLDSTASPITNAPGADDNASGIATLSEAVRATLATGVVPQRTVQVMAYAAEEVGLWGSDDIAGDYFAAGVDVVAVLQQDMTDWHGSTEDVVLISDYTSSELNGFVGALVDTYQPALLRTSSACGYGCSDHASWTARGYRAAFPFESRMNEHDPYIHTPGDTVANLGNSAAHAVKFARLAAAFLVEASLDASPGIFSDGFEGGTTAMWSETSP